MLAGNRRGAFRLGHTAVAGRRCISFALSAKEQELQARVKDFVAEKVIPYEKDERRTPHGPTEGLRTELVGLARQEGLLSGLPEIHDALRSHVTRAVFFEAAGYSMLGPIALNIAAPDEGSAMAAQPHAAWGARRSCADCCALPPAPPQGICICSTSSRTRRSGASTSSRCWRVGV